MKHAARRRTDPAEERARILEVAEEHFRRVGYRKTSVTDIAAELGMSAANVYRFFPSKEAIKESVCMRVMDEAADIAAAAARTSPRASDKLSRLTTAVHRHNKARLVKDRRMHDMMVVATLEGWAGIKAHVERMVKVFEVIIRQGIEAGEFEVEDPAEAARALNTAFTPFFHPILVEHSVDHGEDTDAGLCEQIRFIRKALGNSD